jgi:ATP-dependent RNA helicase SUPV3L1/SUV3
VAEAKTIKTAALQALAPQFHLRADRFYNAPDTEIDYTEQGGLMWGSSAVGKLVAGADALKPRVEVFVDDVAGPEVAEKVQRRLQHFIDRKVAALFEPLLNLGRDEALTGLARGLACCHALQWPTKLRRLIKMLVVHCANTVSVLVNSPSSCRCC